MAKPGRFRRLLWTALGLAVVAGTGLAMRPRPLAVETTAVVRAPLALTLDEQGMTRIRRKFTISAPVAGQLQRVTLEPGDRVRAGEPLVTFLPAAPALLDSRTSAEREAAVHVAEAGLATARAEQARQAAAAAYAATQQARVERLFATGGLSRQALDESRQGVQAANDALAVSRAALRRAEQEVSAARAGLVTSDAARPALVLKAPADGVVLNRRHESAAVVNAGEPLLETGDPRDIEVVVDYLSSDAVRIRPGMPARLAQWGGPGELAARVRRIEPGGFTKVSALGVEEQRVNVILDLVAPSARRPALGDGFRVEARVVVWSSPGVVAAPMSALFRQGGGWAAYVVADGKARLRPVAIAHQSEELAEVTRGLAVGDTIVAYPPDALRDGMAVAPAAAAGKLAKAGR